MGGEVKEGDEPGVTGRLRKSVGPHLAIYLAGVSFALVAAKVLFVANFNSNVALGLLASGDTGRMLVAITISVAPYVFLGVSTLCIGVAFGTAKTRTDRARLAFRVSLVAGAVAGLAALASVPLLLLVAAIVGAGLMIAWEMVLRIMVGLARAIHHRWLARTEPLPAPAAAVAVTAERAGTGAPLPDAIVALVVVVLAVVLVPRALAPPWVPSERLGFIDQTTRAGYVVSDSNGWLTYLTLDRQLVLVPSQSLRSRQLCTTRKGDFRTLPEILDRAPQPPDCIDGATPPTP